MASDLDQIQQNISNPLPAQAAEAPWFAGIIGDHPSQYAKSPGIWNPTFQKLGIEATYLAFDVDEEHLPGLVGALRKHPRLLGLNVTVPYKIQILPHLDEVDEKARRIGAVNTIVREPDGRLVGYNTDGKGFIDCITQPQPGEEEPFIPELRGAEVLLLGAGGAAAAVAHYLAGEVEGGRLFVANRTQEAADALAGAVREAGGKAEAIPEAEVARVAPEVDLIVNTTVKGQTGTRQVAGGKATCLEPYSSLAPARPAALAAPAAGGEADFYARWWKASSPDILENQKASVELVSGVASRVRFYDAIYAPFETVFLRHGRLSGHRTMNGKGMNVCQAAEGFFNRVMAGFLRERGMLTPETYARVLDAMYEVW